MPCHQMTYALAACLLTAWLGTIVYSALSTIALSRDPQMPIRERVSHKITNMSWEPDFIYTSSQNSGAREGNVSRDKSKPWAFATLVCDDASVLSSAVLIMSLLQTGTSVSVIPMLAPAVSSNAGAALASIAWNVSPRRVPEVPYPFKVHQAEKYRGVIR